MGKKSSKQESGIKSGKNISASAIAATAVIAMLASQANIVLTDTNAVLKDLHPDVRSEQRYTRWGMNSEGHRGLVVLNLDGTAIKFIEDYKTKYPAMKTIHC